MPSVPPPCFSPSLCLCTMSWGKIRKCNYCKIIAKTEQINGPALHGKGTPWERQWAKFNFHLLHTHCTYVFIVIIETAAIMLIRKIVSQYSVWKYLHTSHFLTFHFATFTNFFISLRLKFTHIFLRLLNYHIPVFTSLTFPMLPSLIIAFSFNVYSILLFLCFF